MNDTISRQAAIAEFKHYALYDSNRTNAEWVRRIELVLESLPTVDPVKHGKWIVIPQRCENQTFDECKCSVCGTVEYFNSGWKKFNYCATCGARMDL